jgi:hypothetical protein
MNAFVCLPSHESHAQPSAGKHDQCQGYMTVLVVNYGITMSIRILTAVICPIIEFDVGKLRDCFCQEVKWMLAIR